MDYDKPLCLKKENLRVVGICGSIREDGYTKQALQLALKGAKEIGCTVELLNLRDYNLYFCDGLLNQSVNVKSPNNADVFRSKLKAAQGIVIATPEYHGSYSGVLKNALDLCGFDEFEGKIVGLVGVSGGVMGGLTAINSLRDVSRALHAWVIPEQTCVPSAYSEFQDGKCTNEDVEKRLKKVGREVAKFSYLHSSSKTKEFLTLMESGVCNPGAVKQ